MKQSTIFFGSSKYSVIDEKALHEAFGLTLVVTLPDRIDSKTKKGIPNPVKQFGVENGIPVITTEKLTPDIVEKISTYHPNFLVVADFGLILPKTLLELPTKQAINVHHSLLPKYRGPAPVPFAILSGEKQVGVTIICMSSTVDGGDMLDQATYDLTPDDTTDSVLTELNELGSKLAVKVIQNFDEYFKKRIPQDEKKATFTHFMSRNDGFVDIKSPPPSEKLNRMIHAYFPWPGVWTIMTVKGKPLRVKLLPESKIQLEGKKPVGYKDFVNGYREGKEILEKLNLHP